MEMQNYVCLDFEATEHGECLSIGATYDKKRFYSLMRPKKLKDVTPRITELTGIRVSDVENVKLPNDVFEKFIDWVPKNRRFFCYGSYDKYIVKRTVLEKRAKNFVTSRIVDVAPALSTVLGCPRKKEYSLKFCYETLFGEIHQTHNALSDAKMLKKICDYVCDMTDYDLLVFAMNNQNVKEISKDMSDEDFANFNRILSAMSTLRGTIITAKYARRMLIENKEKEILEKVLTN